MNQAPTVMAIPSFILALDQGTTSSRAVLFDRAGTVRGMVQQEIAQHYPKPGWVEHDPREVWQTQLTTAQQVLRQTGTSPQAVAAIGITNQRETAILWDKATGEPLSNALVWQDRRTSAYCDTLREQAGETIQAKTGLLVDSYFSASKFRWLLDHVDGARTRAERGEVALGTVDSWLVWNLTGGTHFVTDSSNASRTLLYNLQTGDWDDELLALFDIPRAALPLVCASDGFGPNGQNARILPELLGREISIAAVLGDQQAALFGQTCFAPGPVKNTYGTGCFLLSHAGHNNAPSPNRLLKTVAWTRQDNNTNRKPSPSFAVEGSVFVGGAVVQWLRDGLGLVKNSSEIEALAQTVVDSGGVYLVPAFSGLGAPYWDTYARGTLCGLTRGTNAGHIARAALEAIAFQVADVVEVMQTELGSPITELRVDGGASANHLLLQFQSDILGLPVVRPTVLETTALGVAYMAGLSTGVWNGLDEVRTLWKPDRVFEPTMPRETAAHKRLRWHKALQRARDWEEHDTP